MAQAVPAIFDTGDPWEGHLQHGARQTAVASGIGTSIPIKLGLGPGVRLAMLQGTHAAESANSSATPTLH